MAAGEAETASLTALEAVVASMTEGLRTEDTVTVVGSLAAVVDVETTMTEKVAGTTVAGTETITANGKAVVGTDRIPNSGNLHRV